MLVQYFTPDDDVGRRTDTRSNRMYERGEEFKVFVARGRQCDHVHMLGTDDLAHAARVLPERQAHQRAQPSKARHRHHSPQRVMSPLGHDEQHLGRVEAERRFGPGRLDLAQPALQPGHRDRHLHEAVPALRPGIAEAPGDSGDPFVDQPLPIQSVGEQAAQLPLPLGPVGRQHRRGDHGEHLGLAALNGNARPHSGPRDGRTMTVPVRRGVSRPLITRSARFAAFVQHMSGPPWLHGRSCAEATVPENIPGSAPSCQIKLTARPITPHRARGMPD
jgi:hypothetical protein